MSPRLGCDLDGVVYFWEKQVHKLLFEHRGVVLGPSETWDHIKNNIAPDDWKWLWSEGIRLGMFSEGEAFPGALETLDQLADDGVKVSLISALPRAGWADRLYWLEQYQVKFDSLHFTGALDKGAVGCDAYVEDNLDNALAIIRATYKPVFLIDKLYNKTEGDSDGLLIRVPDLPAVRRALLDAKEI